MLALHPLRCFVAVAEALNFRRAATRLNMTQPPLSRTIRQLEHELGTDLFTRTSRAVRLTPAGAAFLVQARRMLELGDLARREVRRVSRGESGRVTMGFTAASSYAVLPRLLALARTRLPDVEVVLQEMVTEAQLAALESGALDLGLLRPIGRRAWMSTLRLHREALVVALPPAHKLAGRAEVGIADLAGEPLITFTQIEGRYFHDLIAGLFEAEGAAPTQVLRISQTHSILALVHAGLGVALVPEAAARFHRADIAIRPLRRAAPVTADLLLAWRSDTANPACDALIAQVRQGWDMGTP